MNNPKDLDKEPSTAVNVDVAIEGPASNQPAIAAAAASMPLPMEPAAHTTRHVRESSTERATMDGEHKNKKTNLSQYAQAGQPQTLLPQTVVQQVLLTGRAV